MGSLNETFERRKGTLGGGDRAAMDTLADLFKDFHCIIKELECYSDQ